ncbi:MAG: di-trans,poly-cis-decaprenylcistransferase [Ideonella sp. MAG2]|nr:MAG: di-trans,poly-cis-decaprenylcistransferase [Ideonella sp. MAG2]
MALFSGSPAPSSSASGGAEVPRHVAIVMDGNGRWARKRFMPRVFGHKAGMETVMSVIADCQRRGISYLTLYAFSSENWKRPAEEVSGLMNLVLVGVAKYLMRLAEQGVRIKVVGERAAVSPKVREAWNEAERITADNKGLTLTVAFNYGGRWDVVQACRRAMADGLSAEQITEEALSTHIGGGVAERRSGYLREQHQRVFCVVEPLGRPRLFGRPHFPVHAQRHG